MPKAAYLTAGVESGFVRGDEDLALHPLHRHHEVELNLTEQGMVTYLFGGNYISLQPGQIAVFWAAIPHHIAMMETDAKLHWLCLPMGQMLYWDLPAPLPQQILDGAFVLDHWGACPHFDERVFRCWHHDLKQSVEALRASVLLECEAFLRRLAWSLHQQELSNVPTGTMPGEARGVDVSCLDRQRAAQATRFIATHYQSSLRVEDLAQELGLHPHSVMRFFQKTFGMSTVEYITQLRLAHTQRLLATTESSVAEIAAASGFGSLSHFYSVFTRACGISPQAYRQSLIAR